MFFDVVPFGAPFMDRGKVPQCPGTGTKISPVPGLIHHSDRGSQYAGGKYCKLIGKAHLTQSMSRKGECLDNAPMESFFASLKKELVHRKRFRTRAQAKASIFEYIEVFYNRQRRHSSIGYLTPVQAFEDMTWKMAA